MTKKKKPAKQPKKSAAKLGNRYAAAKDPTTVRKHTEFTRLNDAERDRLIVHAANQGVKKSEYMRDALLTRMRSEEDAGK